VTFAEGSSATQRRIARLVSGSGVLGGVLMVQAVGTLGDTPDPHDSPTSVAAYFEHHDDDVYVSAALAAFATSALIVFICGLRHRLARSGSPIAATVVLTAALGVTGLLLLNELVYATLSWQIASSSPALAKALFAITILSPTVQGPLCATAFAAAATAALTRGSLPGWHAVLGLGAAALTALAGVCFAQGGYFYPDVQQQVVGNAFMLWLLLTAVLCWRPSTSTTTSAVALT
jgi:hypothetical protein